MWRCETAEEDVLTETFQGAEQEQEANVPRDKGSSFQVKPPSCDVMKNSVPDFCASTHRLIYL